MSVKELFLQQLTSVKTAAITGTATAGAGVSTWFDVIPDDIGKLASLIGICLTTVLIVFHIRKGALDIKKAQLEIELIKAEAARSQAADDD